MATCALGGRQIHHDGGALLARKAEGDRVRAEDGLGSSPWGDPGRRGMPGARYQADKAIAGRSLHIIAKPPYVVRVAHQREADAVLLRPLAAHSHRLRRNDLAPSVAPIEQQRRAEFALELELGWRDDLPVSHRGDIGS